LVFNGGFLSTVFNASKFRLLINKFEKKNLVNHLIDKGKMNPQKTRENLLITYLASCLLQTRSAHTRLPDFLTLRLLDSSLDRMHQCLFF
jgi:hypothetical protein